MADQMADQNGHLCVYLSRDAHVVIDRQGTSGTIAGPGLYKTIQQGNKIMKAKRSMTYYSLIPC